MRHIEKPEVSTKVIDKKTLWFNIRESRLMFMFHRNLITMNEYEAGSRYRRMCEIATLGSGSSMQNVKIDGSKQFIGLGNSKKQAQQDGANNLLKSINRN